MGKGILTFGDIEIVLLLPIFLSKCRYWYKSYMYFIGYLHNDYEVKLYDFNRLKLKEL